MSRRSCGVSGTAAPSSSQQTGYEKGAASYLEVLDARQTLRAEQAEYARALADWNVARADLQRAVGGLLP